MGTLREFVKPFKVDAVAGTIHPLMADPAPARGITSFYPINRMRFLNLIIAASFVGQILPSSAATQPNVIVIVMDDVGFSDLGTYGSEIPTPNIDSLASTGVKFRQFYVTPRCSPTRCAILSGLYTQQAASDPAAALPNLNNTNNLTIAELLKMNGYNTYLSGKWHLGGGALLPENRGFQQVFSYVNGTDHSEDSWDISKYRFLSTNGEVTARAYGGANPVFYQTDAIGDYALDFINHDNSPAGGGKPFFLYLAFGAAHYPIQAPKAMIDANVPTYSVGYDVIRQARFNRQMANGIIDSRYTYPGQGSSGNFESGAITTLPAWDTLPADRQADETRRMSIFASMIQKIDENVGRVIAKLTQTGQLDNTLIFLSSDNGANLEGGRFGTFSGSTEGPALTGTALANMGQSGAGDALRVGTNWSHVSNTPFALYKHYAHEGGIRSPLIVHWPAGFASQNMWTNSVGSVIDIMPTVVAATGVNYPTTFNSHNVLPMEGVSLLPALNGTPLPPRSIFIEHESNKMIRKGDWKLVSKNYAYADGTSPANERELYDLSLDPNEAHNVALDHPTRVVEMVDEWNAWGTRVGVPSNRNFIDPPLTSTPAPNPADLFLDTFNRPDNVLSSASSTGMSGSRVPPIGTGAWFEGWEGSGSTDSVKISGNVLQMATGVGMSESGLNHNFIGQDIIDAGGFSISLRVLQISTDATDTTNRFAGFGVGLNATQASKGNDIGSTTPPPIRGKVGNPGVADCFVELDLDGNVKVWVHGVLKSTVAVGKNTGTLTASYSLGGFATNSMVTLSVYFDRKRLDINSAADSDTQTFTWDEANANYVALSARASNYVQMDNFAIRKLPLANALAIEYALAKGADGADSAPGSNPDGDSISNYAEYALGTDPTKSDDFVSGTVLTFTDLPAQGFRFAHRRLSDFTNEGFNYTYTVSSDLKTWQNVTPTVVGATPLAASPGYETVELRLPDSAILSHDRLFVRIELAQ
jgi:arylsulfatase A-like enzyme